MADDDRKARIRALLTRQGQHETPPDDDTALFEAGYLDSLTMLHLIPELEQAFDVAIEDLEVLPGNFETVEALDRFVASKLDDRGDGGG